MEHLILLLIIGAIALAKSFLSRERTGDAPTIPSPTLRPTQRPAATPDPGMDDEERMRKFLEALGIPANTPAPRPVVPKQAPAPPPVQHPPTSGWPLPQAPRTMPPPLFQPKPEPAKPKEYATPKREAAVPFEPRLEPHLEPQRIEAKENVERATDALELAAPPQVGNAYALPETVAAEGPSGTSLADGPVQLWKLLRARDTARTAFVLREVLGPPKALQS